MKELPKPPQISPKQEASMLKKARETAPTKEIELNLTKKIEQLEKKIAENDE